jgi:aminoglycoside/choline kinase family phosphotransferase
MKPPAAPAPEAVRPASDALVEEWFVETFHGMDLKVEHYNRFRAAADRLKARLAGKE